LTELTLTLIRGLPGSGKSTLAKKMQLDSQGRGEDLVHLEADMFFIDDNGVYCFQPLLISKAHQWCQQQCALFLKQKNSVVVSNTFVKQWELKAYRQLAKQYKAKLAILTCTGSYQNIHEVPESTIKKMKRQWQPE
jgi:predicted kinase